MIKTPNSLLTTVGLGLLVLPTAVLADTLTLPADARVAVAVVDSITLDDAEGQRNDILLRPVGGHSAANHALPEHCVLVGNARLDDERIRITTHALTCIEAQNSDSEIYSGEISAAAYEDDGSYGVLANCVDGRCELAPDTPFVLQLSDALSLEQQPNPSAEINEQRRQADGEGVANPIPSEAPAPD
ncbi:hypothetical protein [Billgrantia gudaonensis]|uniref:Uncharacterized protein n=1 Tax=Billgrantia gudaonensis TaxID=376427 RepID=A0A1G8TGN6_9GAMM|nr:hypothetical protein [Halomonas gudaonensis]SDJ40716.1 hypothetical protein SAMN04487954_104303 [Halomonas gudaonensis]